MRSLMFTPRVKIRPPGFVCICFNIAQLSVPSFTKIGFGVLSQNLPIPISLVIGSYNCLFYCRRCDYLLADLNWLIWQVLVVDVWTCWYSYGIKEVKGINRLSGAGLETQDAPGMLSGGGKWPGRWVWWVVMSCAGRDTARRTDSCALDETCYFCC